MMTSGLLCAIVERQFSVLSSPSADRAMEHAPEGSGRHTILRVSEMVFQDRREAGRVLGELVAALPDLKDGRGAGAGARRRAGCV